MLQRLLEVLEKSLNFTHMNPVMVTTILSAMGLYKHDFEGHSGSVVECLT